MASKPTLKTYLIGAVITTWCEVEIRAENIDDALAQAHEFEHTDFITYKGSCNDESMKIIQVFDQDLSVDL